MNQNLLQLGTWLSIGSPVIAELAGLCGFDWLLLDLEHGCGSEAALPEQLRALRGSATRGVVRVGAPHPDLIARVLDWGARGLMVPHVNSAAEAETIVRAAHYPPRGKRGFSRTVRAHDYGMRPPETTPAPLLLVQIETREAVMQAAEIARVDGVDVLFVGPADLQHDLKQRAPLPGEDYEACLCRVVEAARTAGKAAGILVRDSAELQPRLNQGFTHVAVQSDLSVLRDAYQKLLQTRPVRTS